MIAYYLDPMASQPCDDLEEIVNIWQCFQCGSSNGCSIWIDV
ncbi:hypothetical protein CK203_068923 [Vitis vinifera]|uniref:Uncharacterized protein n=1 Tax=Vitis vinifera TaxID=29760 RepID=A0A438F0M7_VITVI|nr:hypothetical protein CK203_068923 [Vitis vinifera]